MSKSTRILLAHHRECELVYDEREQTYNFINRDPLQDPAPVIVLEETQAEAMAELILARRKRRLSAEKKPFAAVVPLSPGAAR